MTFNVLTTTACELQQELDVGKISSVQIVEVYLKQISEHEDYLHALIAQPPRESILQRAQELDDERRAGKSQGQLHGIPVLLKDNIATHPDLGMDTTAGSLALVGCRPKKNAVVVERLLKAGAIIIGKANLSELSCYKGSKLDWGWSAMGGQTQSAYVRGGFRMDDSFAGHSNPAGSSSGSAVGVTAGYAPVSLGTETEGSLILPAGRGALYTIKPTISIISQEGIVPITSLFDSAGPLTKCVRDLAILMDVLVDQDKTTVPQGGYTSAVTGNWDGLRIGSLDPDVWTFSTSARKSEPKADEQMKDDAREAYAKLQKLTRSFKQDVSLILSKEFELHGKHVIRTLFNHGFKNELPAFLRSVEGCKVSNLAELIAFNKKHADKELPPRNPRQDRLEDAEASNLTSEEVAECIAHGHDVARKRGIDEIFEKYDINIVIGPAESAMTEFASAAGYPIASLPLGYVDFNGRPHGLAAIAKAHQEATLIQLQSAWEAHFPERRTPPL